LIDFLVEALFTPSPVWIGTILGILVACGAWFFLPETIDRASIGAWSVAIGFFGGCIFFWPHKKDKK
jgi:hypothetical protein